jgi:trans-aconitate methyltransferase
VATHWDEVYGGRDPRTVSWYEADPVRSFEWVRAVAPDHDAAIVDVGGGASALVDRLVGAGYTDITVLDVARSALDVVRARLGDAARGVRFVTTDVLTWAPDQHYDVWHDRAVFHFLVDADDRARYVAVLHAALRLGGHAVIATFAPGGPDRCSGLPTMRYDADALVATLGCGFTLVRSSEADHTTPAGTVQPFTWVAVRRTR